VISVVIPTIPTRSGETLMRAVWSAERQSLAPTAVVIEPDTERLGASQTRQRGLQRVTTEWVAFLDDDDELLPEHLEHLLACATEQGADYVYSWYEVVGGLDPMPQFFGRPWDNEQPHQTTITTLVRTELAQSVGFGGDPEADPNGGGAFVSGEDYRFTLGCMAAGAKIVHLPERTWFWHHHGGNTSGLPSRW
jgi:hypothetical protein